MQLILKTVLLFLLLTLVISIVGLWSNNKILEQVLLSAVVILVSFAAGRLALNTFGGGERTGLVAGVVLLLVLCLCSVLVYKTAPQVKQLLIECVRIFPAALLGSMEKDKKRGPRRK